MQKDSFQVYKALSGTYLKILLFKAYPYFFFSTYKGHFLAHLKILFKEVILKKNII